MEWDLVAQQTYSPLIDLRIDLWGPHYIKWYYSELLGLKRLPILRRKFLAPTCPLRHVRIDNNRQVDSILWCYYRHSFFAEFEVSSSRSCEPPFPERETFRSALACKTLRVPHFPTQFGIPRLNPNTQFIIVAENSRRIFYITIVRFHLKGISHSSEFRAHRIALTHYSRKAHRPCWLLSKVWIQP